MTIAGVKTAREMQVKVRERKCASAKEIPRLIIIRDMQHVQEQEGTADREVEEEEI